MGEQVACLGQELAAGPVRQPLIGEHKSQAIAGISEIRHHGPGCGDGAHGFDAVRPTVAVLELASDQVDHVRIVVDREDDGRSTYGVLSTWIGR